MTDDIARELGELLEKATAGGWFIVPYGDGDSLVIHSDDENRVFFPPVPVGYSASPGSNGNPTQIEADMTFIAAARNHLPALLSSRAADRKRIEVLEEALRWFINDIDGKHTVMRDFDVAVERARAALAGGTDEADHHG